MIFITWIACFVLAKRGVGGIDYQSEHVLTVCDANTVSHTRAGEAIPQCPSLPSPDGFFDGLKKILYQHQCDDLNSTLSQGPSQKDSSDATLVQFGILALKRLVDGLKGEVNKLVQFIVGLIGDFSGLSPVIQRWDSKRHLALICIMSVLLHLQKRRSKQIILNGMLGFFASSTFYLIHCYYQNYFITLFFICFAVLACSPHWPSCLRSVGLLSIFQLMLPLLGIILRITFIIQLLIGPMIYLVLNGASVLIHVFCLIGLYIDEKLIIIKVFLLPFYQMLLDLFVHNEKHTALLDLIRQSLNEMTAGLMGYSPGNGTDAGQLEELFSAQLRRLCENATVSFYATCPELFDRSCKSFVDQTFVAKADKDLETAGKWLADLLMTGSKSTSKSSVQRTAAKEICGQFSDSVCRIVDLSGYCTPDETFYGRSYGLFITTLEKLKDAVLISPWIKLKSLIDPDDRLANNFSFDFDLIGLIYHSTSLILAVFLLALFVRALIPASLFLRRYRKVGPSSTPIKWKTSIRIGMLVQTSVCFALERAVQSLHEMLQNIQFRVPEYGFARFAFNVQGNGTIAKILSSILGGFNLQSRYCTVADSKVCSTLFFPVGWRCWAILFSVASFYTFIDLIQSNSDYWMSCLCRVVYRDVQNEEAGKKEGRRILATRMLAEEALQAAIEREEMNRHILIFYRQFKYRSFTPVLIQSLMAHYKFDVGDLHCQICYQDLISARFRHCITLLFCHHCATHLSQCPCCNSRRIIRV